MTTLAGPASGGRPLLGRRIVITRPREQAARLATALEQAGAEPVVFPLIEIGPPADPAALAATIDQLERFDWAVFSSPTAVDQAIARIRARRALPQHWSVAAIGEGTERALARHGIAPVLAPRERFDSEALLALGPLADLHGRSVVIFRGQDGRQTLGDGLTARGAQVHYAGCYTRSPPAADGAGLLARARRGELDALILTSSEAVRTLAALAGGELPWLAALPVFVPHARIAEAARAAGFTDVVQTAGGDDGVFAGLCAALGRSPGDAPPP
jgi:uroporphyrinogen-III synthase